MQKIPTLFQRNAKGYVTSKVDPECQWVLDGEGRASRQYDGLCLLKDEDQWWVRHVAAPDETWPAVFAKCQYLDDGSVIGWVPVDREPVVGVLLAEALSRHPADTRWPWETYELYGPDINLNPEQVDEHRLVYTHGPTDLVPHAFTIDPPRTFIALKKWMAAFEGKGVVWHHMDGRKAKIQRLDFEAT